MESLITHTACPACGAASIRHVLNATDHTVSKKEFGIWECGQCTLRFTQAVPDERHIGPYYRSENYVSHTNTEKGLINRLYHIVRRRTLRNKWKLIESAGPRMSRNLLDVGAGTGSFAHYMRQHAWQVTGLEPDDQARSVALSQHKLSLLPPEELWQMSSSTYDVITMWHVLEHVHRLHEYLEQFKTLLKPGGLLFIAVPNYTSLDAALYGKHWAAYDVPRHLYHFSPAAMKALLGKHGLRVKAIRPMWFDSFYVSMLSEQYRSGRSRIIKGAINGLRSNWNAWRDRERCSSLIYIVSA